MNKTTIFLLLLIVACTHDKQADRNGSFGFADHFKKMCGFELPNSIKIIHEFDNGEGCGEALYNVDKNEIRTFTKQRQFIPRDKFLSLPDMEGSFVKDKSEALAHYDLRMNNDEKYKLKNYKDLMFYAKCNNQNLFTLIADTNSNLLWLNIEYPDMAGDGPKCGCE